MNKCNYKYKQKMKSRLLEICLPIKRKFHLNFARKQAERSCHVLKYKSMAINHLRDIFVKQALQLPTWAHHSAGNQQ